MVKNECGFYVDIWSVYSQPGKTTRRHVKRVLVKTQYFR